MMSTYINPWSLSSFSSCFFNALVLQNATAIILKYAIVSFNITRKNIVLPPIRNHSGNGLTSLAPHLRNCPSNLKYNMMSAVTVSYTHLTLPTILLV